MFHLHIIDERYWEEPMHSHDELKAMGRWFEAYKPYIRLVLLFGGNV